MPSSRSVSKRRGPETTCVKQHLGLLLKRDALHPDLLGEGREPAFMTRLPLTHPFPQPYEAESYLVTVLKTLYF